MLINVSNHLFKPLNERVSLFHSEPILTVCIGPECFEPAPSTLGLGTTRLQPKDAKQHSAYLKVQHFDLRSFESAEPVQENGKRLLPNNLIHADD